MEFMYQNIIQCIFLVLIINHIEDAKNTPSTAVLARAAVSDDITKGKTNTFPNWQHMMFTTSFYFVVERIL